MTTATLPIGPLLEHAVAVLDLDPDAMGPGYAEGATLTDGRLADAIGVNRRTVYRWRHDGLNGAAADLAATALGSHPAVIWPEWDLVEVDALTFAVTCPTCAGPVCWERPLKAPKHDAARQSCRVVCSACATDYRVTVTIEAEELDE